MKKMFSDYKKIVFTLTALIAIVGYSFVVFAAAPNGGYNPGQILDPDCAPGDVDCVVKLQISGGGSPAGSDNQIQINQSGSFFADSTFQKSDTGFNVGLNHTTQSAVTFTGSGLDNILVNGSGYSGTGTTNYVVSIDGINKDYVYFPTSSISGSGFQVGETITSTSGGSATIDAVNVNSNNSYENLILSSITGTFLQFDTITGGTSGTTAVLGGDLSQQDTYTWTDGTTTVSNVICKTPYSTLISNNVLVDFDTGTGHTLSDSWTWTYSTANQNVLDFSNNDYKFQSTFGTDTFGYQIGDNLFGAGLKGSLNTYSNVAGDQMLTGYADVGGIGFIGFNSVNSYSTKEIASIYANKNGVGYSMQDSFGENVVQTTSGVTTLGNLSGGNNTKITIDDIAQTINFNNNYSFPFADGAAGQVLGTDGSGQLGWVTVSGGSVSPISIGTSGNTLYSSGLSGTGQGDTSTGNNIFLGINAGNGATDAFNSNFFGNGAGYGATSASNSNFLGTQAGSGATNASFSNFLGPNAGANATDAYNSNFFGNGAGNGATDAFNSNFFGNGAGNGATDAFNSNFFGTQAGSGATNASNSIFIGKSAGYNDLVNNTGDSRNFSILIGPNTSTGNNGSGVGYSNSIALGGYATNTASNQFMIGSTTRPINETRFQGSVIGTQCTITTGTGIACTSDERLKENIIDLSPTVLEDLMNIKTVHYNLISDTTHKPQIGFLAQNLEQYFPELVDTDRNSGFKSVYYAQMTPILVEAIREMNLKITTINDIETPNTWRDAIIAWFGNIENGITKLFVKEIETKTLCVADDTGDKTCITKAQLDQLLNNAVGGSIAPSPSPDPVPDPGTGENIAGGDSTTGGDVPTDTSPSSGDTPTDTPTPSSDPGPTDQVQ